MELSEARRSHLAHAIVRVLRAEGLLELEPVREKHVLHEIRRVFEREQELDLRVDSLVRRKISSLSRQVPLGSPEWDVLYRKYYEEESRRLKSGGG